MGVVHLVLNAALLSVAETGAGAPLVGAVMAARVRMKAMRMHVRPMPLRGHDPPS